MISITENGNVRYENQTDVDRELLANEKSPKYYYDETVRLSAAAQTAQEAAEEAAEAAMASTPEGYADFVDNLAPAYSSSATYSAGDYVLHESILYRANADISTAEDWTAAHWTEVRTMTEVSDLKEDLDTTNDALSGEIDGINSSSEKTLSITNWVNKSINGDNGSTFNSTTRIIPEDYVDISPYVAISFVPSSGYKWCVHFYDKGKNWIDHSDVGLNTTPLTVPVPESAAYALFIIANTSNTEISTSAYTNLTISGTSKIADCVNTIGDLENLRTESKSSIIESINELSEIAETVEETDNLCINRKSFWNQGGYNNTAISYKVHSDKIDVPKFETLYFGGICTGTQLSSSNFFKFMCYDSNDTLLYTSSSFSLSATWHYLEISGWTAYTDTSYIVIEFSTNVATVSVNPKYFAENYKIYLGYTRIASFDDWYDHYKYSDNVALLRDDDGKPINILYWVNKSVHGGNGSTFNSSTRIIPADFIDVSGYASIKGIPLSGYKYSISFYDANQGYMKGCGVGWTLTTSEVLIPDSAKYARIVIANTSDTNISTNESGNVTFKFLYKVGSHRRAELKIVDNINKFAKHTRSSSNTSLTLLHFSDLHYDASAMGRIMSDSGYFDNVDDAICTGDMRDNEGGAISDWWNPSILTCVGNHDSVTVSGGAYNWTAISMADRDTYYIAPFESNWGITHTSGTSYYYKDYADAGVRLIVMDSMLYSSYESDTSLAAAQTEWLNNLLSDAITNSLHVLIAIHAPHGGATPKSCSFSKYGATTMPTRSDCDTPQTVVDTVASAITSGLKFIGYICGHTHQDNIWDAEGDGKQLMYCVTCAKVNDPAFWISSDQYRDGNNDAYNLITIDTSHTLVKLVRGGGANIDDHMRPRKAICIDYSTGTVVGEAL